VVVMLLLPDSSTPEQEVAVQPPASEVNDAEDQDDARDIPVPSKTPDALDRLRSFGNGHSDLLEEPDGIEAEPQSDAGFGGLTGEFDRLASASSPNDGGDAANIFASNAPRDEKAAEREPSGEHR